MRSSPPRTTGSIEHHGIDFRRTGAAALATLSGNRQGGSTITQQLARNMYPEEIGRALSINRKVKEAITALKIESVYTKDEILETYLNTVPFLYNAFGIEMAARTYFDKTRGQAGRAGERHADRHAQGHQLLQPGAQPRARPEPPQSGAGTDGQARQAGPGEGPGAGSAAVAPRFRTAGRAAGTGAARRAASAQMADRVGGPQRLRHLRRRAGGAHHHRLQAAASRQPGRGAPDSPAAETGGRPPQGRRGAPDAAGRLPGAGPAQRFRAGLGRQPGLRQRNSSTM